jgi:hypothetical protein
MIHVLLLVKQYWIAAAWLASSVVLIAGVAVFDGDTSFKKTPPDNVGSVVISVPGPVTTVPGPVVTIPGPVVVVPGPTVTAPPTTITASPEPSAGPTLAPPPTTVPTATPIASPSPTPTASTTPPVSPSPTPTRTPKNHANGLSLFCLAIVDHDILIKVPCPK